MKKRLKKLLCRFDFHFYTKWVEMSCVQCLDCGKSWYDNPYFYT